MPSPATLFWGMPFGSIGAGWFIHGKRQAMIVPLACGIALVVYPWFVSSLAWLVVAGLVLAAIPCFLRY